MTKKDLELIKYYQKWRRDDNNDPLTRLPMPNAREVGMALDKMIAYCETNLNDKNDKKRD